MEEGFELSPQVVGIAAGCTVFVATILTVIVLLVQGGSIERLKKELRGEAPAPAPKVQQPRLVDELCFSCRAPFRDGAHCLRCGTCVARRDHHCALLDRCVHAGNVNAFRLLLFLTLLAGASCLRVGVWSFAGVADERDAWPPDPRVWTRGLLGPRGCTCLLLLVLVPLGLVAVAYECARHALRAAGVERRFLDDGAGKKDD